MTLLPFILPEGFSPLVKEDDKVKEGDILAQNSVPSEVSIDIASDLSIPVRKVRTALKKNPGEQIAEGDVIAEKKGVMGGKIIKSTIKGTISRLDDETGSLVVKTGENTRGDDKIVCPVDGVVTLATSTKILVKTDKEAIVADKFSGQSYSGEALKLKSTDVRDIGSDVEDRVVIVDKLTREDLAKLLALGVGAVVTSEIDDSVFSNLEAKSIETPVIRISEKDMEAFSKNVNRVVVDGEKGVVLKA